MAAAFPCRAVACDGLDVRTQTQAPPSKAAASSGPTQIVGYTIIQYALNQRESGVTRASVSSVLFTLPEFAPDLLLQLNIEIIEDRNHDDDQRAHSRYGAHHVADS